MTDGKPPHRQVPLAAGARLDDADRVLRRLSDSGPNMITADRITGERRPSSGAFKPDHDGVSVYSLQLMEAAGVAATDLLDRPGNILVRLAVVGIRRLHALDENSWLDVLADPWPTDAPDPEHPRNAAHALIVGLQDLSKRQRKELQERLARLAEFVEQESPGA